MKKTIIKILIILSVVVIVGLWIIIGILNFTYLAQFIESSIYWIEAVVIFGLIISKKINSGKLLTLGVVLLIIGGGLNLIKQFLGESVLRVALILLLSGSLSNFIEIAKKDS